MSELKSGYIDVTAKDEDLVSSSSPKEHFEGIMDDTFGGKDLAHEAILAYIKRRNNLNPTRMARDTINRDFNQVLVNICILLNEERGSNRTYPRNWQINGMKSNVAQLYRDLKSAGVKITDTGFKFPKHDSKIEVEED